jgi:hypothetical protein
MGGGEEGWRDALGAESRWHFLHYFESLSVRCYQLWYAFFAEVGKSRVKGHPRWSLLSSHDESTIHIFPVC